MGLEDRYSNLGGRPWNVANKSTITSNSALASKPQDVKIKPAVTNESVLAFKPVDIKVKPINTSLLGIKPQNPTEKLSKGIIGRNSLFAAVTPVLSGLYIVIPQAAGSSPTQTPAPTPMPGIGAFSTAFSNAYDGVGLSTSAFSAAFSNAF